MPAELEAEFGLEGTAAPYDELTDPTTATATDPPVPTDEPGTEPPPTEEDRQLEASGPGSERDVISAAQQRSSMRVKGAASR